MRRLGLWLAVSALVVASALATAAAPEFPRDLETGRIQYAGAGGDW